MRGLARTLKATAARSWGRRSVLNDVEDVQPCGMPHWSSWAPGEEGAVLEAARAALFGRPGSHRAIPLVKLRWGTCLEYSGGSKRLLLGSFRWQGRT
jgi:hypothetical protein